MKFIVGKVDRVKLGEGKDVKHVATAHLHREGQGWEREPEIRVLNHGLAVFNEGDVVEISLVKAAPVGVYHEVEVPKLEVPKTLVDMPPLRTMTTTPAWYPSGGDIVSPQSACKITSSVNNPLPTTQNAPAVDLSKPIEWTPQLIDLPKLEPVDQLLNDVLRDHGLSSIESISWDEPVVEEIELLPVVGEDLHEADIPGAPQGLLACYLEAEKKK